MAREFVSIVASVVLSAFAGQAAEQKEVVSGVRATWGDAVHCPQIRADDGSLHPVSYLPPDIPVGARVTARGIRAVTIGCVGSVLVVESIETEN